MVLSSVHREAYHNQLVTGKVKKFSKICGFRSKSTPKDDPGF
jgi:hypothetical protein